MSIHPSTPGSTPPGSQNLPETTTVATRARMTRFAAGFLLFGILWASGLAMVANVLLAPAIAVISDRVPLQSRGTMSAFFGAGQTAGFPLGAIIGAAFITTTLPGYALAAALMLAGGVLTLFVWPRERSAADLPARSGGFLELIKSFHPPSPRVAPDFYRAFVGRLFMLMSYQMITAYQLYIVQNHVGQSTVESAKTIATMSVITLIVGLVAARPGAGR